MLPSKSRLTKDEVKEVFDKGSRAANQSGSVIFLKHGQSKAAVVVSKKIASSAVVRNRMRRRIYSAIKDIYPSIYFFHIAILPSKALVDVQGEELMLAVKSLLQKARLIASS